MRKHRKWRIGRIALLATVSIFLLTGGLIESKHFYAFRSDPASHQRDEALKKYNSIPLYFERNLGQSDPSVRFLSHTNRSSLFLTDDSAVITLIGGSIHNGRLASAKDAAKDKLLESAVRIRLLGANEHPRFETLEPLPGRVNYLIGKDPSKFHRDVPIFGRIRQKDVYPGIDLVYYGTPNALEYDLVAAPGADTSKLKFAVEGGDQTAIDGNGNLVVASAAGMLMVEKPRVFQREASGKETPIEGAFAMAGKSRLQDGIARHEVTFKLASYDHSRALRIDPVFKPEASSAQYPYSTYLGGTGSSTGRFFNRTLADISGGDITLNVADGAMDVAVDQSNGATYVAGIAYSSDFPTKLAFQGSSAGANSPPARNPNAFVSRFNYSVSGPASLIFSTYIGGSGDINPDDTGRGLGDFASGIAEDASGNTFIVGQTFSEDFPNTASCGSFGQSNTHGSSDTGIGFVAKLDSTGGTLTYACYIGGTNSAIESRVALVPSLCDGSSCIYVVGSTNSDITTGFPVMANIAFQSTFASGSTGAASLMVIEDGFNVATQPALVYSTIFGGSGNLASDNDVGLAVTADSSNAHAFITGATYSSDLPTRNPQQSSNNAVGIDASNAFVAEFDPFQLTDSSLLYSTYLGGSGATGPAGNDFVVGDVGTGIAFDSSNSTVWVTGYTASTDFPVPGGGQGITPSFQPTNEAAVTAGPPATAAFITQLNPATPLAAGILYSTYFSGTGSDVAAKNGSVGFGDAATGIVVAGGKVFITGLATSGVTAHSFPASLGACYQANSSSGLGFLDGTVPVTSFVLKLDPTQAVAANQRVFATLLAGRGQANITGGIQITGPWIVVAGTTYSTDYPVSPGPFTAAFQSHNQTTGSSQAFLSVINPIGTACLPTSTATATATATATPSDTATATATETASATMTTTATETATATASETATATQTETATATATGTATITATATATETATATMTETATATATETATATSTITQTSTPTPTAPPTATSTQTSSASPTPTLAPTPTPTSAPTSTPTLAPTPSPSSPPTPSATSTANPTGSATIAPTAIETLTMTSTPTPAPGGSVDLVEPASGGGKPGADVGLGSVGYTPDTVNQQIISSVSVTVTHPKVFSSLTLSAFLNAVPAGTVTINAPNIASTTVFTFNPVITIPSGGGQTLTFTFNGVISGGQSASLDIHNIKLAGLFVGTSSGGGTGSLLFSLSLLGFVMVPLSNKQRRRASFLAAALLTMATAMAGCGGGGSSGGGVAGQPANKSTQQIVAVDVTESGNQVGVANLPIDLGTVTKK